MYIEGNRPYSLTEIYRDLAIHMERSLIENEIALQRLAGAFRAACGLMATEVALWIIALAVTL